MFTSIRLSENKKDHEFNVKIKKICKRVVLLTFFLRNNSFKALIFAQAKTLITAKVHRRDDFDVNSFSCI